MGRRVRSEIQPASGVLYVYKPRGMSSRDVSRKLGIALGGRLNCGHAGTLDPMAEGVLPLLFGRASRIQDYLVSREKGYRFCMELGRQTDTLDADGQIVSEQPVQQLSMHLWQSAADAFLGDLVQSPPMYSAVKRAGRPLYEYARAGVSLDTSAHMRKVEIKEFKIEQVVDHRVYARVKCSSGTYVRELGRTLAEQNGNVMTVTYLERYLSAGVESRNCPPLTDVVARCEREGVVGLEQYVVPIVDLDLGLPKVCVDTDDTVQQLFYGQRLCPTRFSVVGTQINEWSGMASHSCVLLVVDHQGKAIALADFVASESDRGAWIKIKRSLV
ncbi:MAG: tRNA pseudouridine(55) synthase TruB [Zetaproteobacteria bacterium]|nr:tRNA pseudouridine(55) synthase TruB [Zetaproteobacteria bacterium]